MEVGFYHCTREPMLAVVPRLAAKAYAAGHRLLVRAEEDLLAGLDEAMWTYEAASFLPHGREPAAVQPILLSTAAEPANGADLLLQCAVPLPEPLAGWMRVLHLFEDGTEAQARARAEWKALGTTDVTRSYWKQDARGRWEKAA